MFSCKCCCYTEYFTMLNFAGFTHCWLSQLLCLMSHRSKILLSMDWFLLRESTFFSSSCLTLFIGYLVNNHSFCLFAFYSFDVSITFVLICLIGRDGAKMSKRKKNYPDPMEIVNKYGADALRWVGFNQQC